MTRVPAAALAFLLCAGAPGAAEPDPGRGEAGVPFLRSFGPRDYGAGVQNWGVVQDPRGVIYVANNDGVLEFDGVRWVLIPTANRTSVRSLAVDPSGQVYVGAKGDIGRLERDAAGTTRYVSLLPLLPEDARDFADVWQTFSTPEGVYFSTFKRLMRLQGGQFRVWLPQAAFHRAFQVGGRFFVREPDRGLLEMVGDRLQLVPGGERFAQQRVDALLTGLAGASGGGPAGSLLACTRAGFFALDEAGVHPFPTELDERMAKDLLYSAVELPDGTIVLGTFQGGVYFMDRRGSWRGRLDKTRGLPDDTVYAVASDREGGLWLSLGRGLARLQAGSALTHFDERTGLPGAVLSLHRHLGTLYVGTAQGLFRLDPGPEPRFRPVPEVRSLTWSMTSWGGALLVANYQGVYEVRGEAAVLVRKVEAMALLASSVSPGRLFVGLRDGLLSLREEAGRWREEGRVEGVAGEVRSLLEMPDGRLWVGTWASGVQRAHPGPDLAPLAAVERFGPAQGLPSVNQNRVYRVRGEAVFATQQGVYRFQADDGRFRPHPQLTRLFPGARGVAMLQEDGDSGLWLHSADQAANVHETGAALRQADGSYRWDPTPLAAFAGSWIESAHRDDDGVLWFGGDEGLYRYDPRTPRSYGQPYAAVMRRVRRTDGELLAGGGGEVAELSHLENALRFEYAAPTFDKPEATRFQVLLEGNDPGWAPWTADGFREYTNLEPGAYRFRVRARNLYGTLSQEAGYAFRILPPWYRTSWARAGYLLGALGLAWGLLHWRLRRLDAEKRSLEAVVAQRTRALQAKNAQLETLNAIVKSINERQDFDELLEAMLRACRVIRGVERAAALARLPARGVFTFRASLGFPREELAGLELELAEAEARYTEDAEEVSEDIFLVRRVHGRAGEAKLRLLVIPKALLVMRIRIEGQVEGYLVFENQQHEDAFDERDLDLLTGLREHFVSAFQRALSLRLLDRALADAEGARGRAEEREREAETQRRAAEEERTRAEEASRAKSAFLASMSHELRTPLNGILGFAQLMDREPHRSPQDQQHLGTILRSGEHLLALINDVLSLSKIEAGRLALAESAFDLAALLRGLEDLLRLRAQGKDLWLKVESGGLPPAVVGDEGRLRQILLNLLGNAVKFTEEGGVTLRARWGQGRATFEVEDTGPGIAPHEREQLFEPFVQAEAGRRSREGTGLGLALSRQLARQMGGDVAVESEAGRGACFRLELPLREAAAPVPAPRDDRRRVRALAPGQPPWRVLVVDDVLDNRLLLSRLLGSVGFAVREAAAGAEAVAIWREWRPHLVWMDKRMPGMDGLEATRRIRAAEAEEGCGRTRIIALSASALDHEREEILAAGCDDFVPKPLREGVAFARAAEQLGAVYVYEEPPAAEGGPPAATVTADRLCGQPEAWLAAMREALAVGDTKRAAALADGMAGPDSSLVADVRAMLAAYRLDELEAVLAAALHPSGPPPA